MVGIVSPHPKHLKSDFDPNSPCRYFIRFPLFSKTFSNITTFELFQNVASYCSRNKSGPLGDEEILFKDDNGDNHIFYFDSFSNSYDVLTLGVYQVPPT